MSNRILIDPQAFAADRETLQGSVDLGSLDKRVWSHDITDLSSVLHYSLSGGKDGWQRPFLALSLSGSLKLRCQRCMQPMDYRLDENVRIVLFSHETELDEAMAADETLEGMVTEAETDVWSLLEDQILMALPFSPKHEHCTNAELETVNQNKPNPFAVLSGLSSN